MLLLACGCEKELDHTIAEGQVVDAVTGKPVAGAAVAVMEKENWNFSGGYKQIVTTYADGDGRYSLSFNTRDDYNYSLAGVKEGSYFTSSDYVSVKKNRKNKVNVPLTPKAWLKMHIKNVNPVNEHDIVKIVEPGGSRPFFRGQSIDTVFIQAVNPVFPVKIYYWSTKGGITKEKKDTVSCPPLDTTHYYINY